MLDEPCRVPILPAVPCNCWELTLISRLGEEETVSRRAIFAQQEDVLRAVNMLVAVLGRIALRGDVIQSAREMAEALFETTCLGGGAPGWEVQTAEIGALLRALLEPDPDGSGTPAQPLGIGVFRISETGVRIGVRFGFDDGRQAWLVRVTDPPGATGRIRLMEAGGDSSG